MSKMTAPRLADLLGYDADMVGKKRNGNFMVRRGYYFSNSKTEWDFAGQIVDKINLIPGHHAKAVDCGNHFVPVFKGGKPVTSNSHFWVEVSISFG